MNFNMKNTKYTIAIFAVFAISGLLYTSSVLQYGLAQSNSSSGGGAQGNSSSSGSPSGQKQNDIGSIQEMKNATGSNQAIIGNNTGISNSSVAKVTKENNMEPIGNQSNNSGAQSQGNQSSSSGAQSQGNQSSSSGAQSQGNQSSNPLGFLTNLLGGGKK
jgi:hypothetical protein